jgi:membrane-bound metal-dependent hydrolase YbcI (DUF457 family)
MIWIGHIGLAALVAAVPVLVVGSIWGPVGAIILLSMALATARLPDQVEYSVNRRFGMTEEDIDNPDVSSNPFDDENAILTHRGVTHTVLFLGCVTFLAGVLTSGALTLANDVVPIGPEHGVFFVCFGVIFGIGSHLVGDIITKGGRHQITPWWPFNRRPYQLGWTKADSPVWNGAFFVLGLAFQAAALLEVVN